METIHPQADKQEFMQHLRRLRHRADAGVFRAIEVAEKPDLKAAMGVDLRDPRKVVFAINREKCLEQFHFSSIEMAMVVSHELNHIYEDALMISTAEGGAFKEYFDQHLKSK